MEQSTLWNVDLWSGREKKKRKNGMARKRAENREGSLGFPGHGQDLKITRKTASSVEDLEEADDSKHRDSAPVMCETHPSRFSMPYGGRGQVFAE
ncbi:hypothetical protein TNCV_345041 [Trichonephila clavipes]|nr:hypothetical protein TNCV_345041 [Trichonephila clavipes]